MNQIPERLINYRVYLEGNALAGIATIDLPELENMADTVSGAGIAGEVESPILGHYGSQTTTITWRTIEKDAMRLAAPQAHSLECRGSQQVYDAGDGRLRSVPVRVTMRVVPKRIAPGTFEVGSTTDTETEFEVVYIKIVIDGETMAEIDKYNFKAVFNGQDYLASVRRDLGM